MSTGLSSLIKESLSRVHSLKDIQLMSLAKSVSVLTPSDKEALHVLRSEACRRGRLLDQERAVYDGALGQSNIAIAWENRMCMVVDKPQGMVVSLDGDLDESSARKFKSRGKSPELNQILSQDFPGIPIFSDSTFAHGILHRLDRDTTGALLVAKTFQSFFDLRMQFAAGMVGKEYTCLVEGTPGKLGEWNTINMRIETRKFVDAEKNLSFTSKVVEEGGNHARTDFIPVATFRRKQTPHNRVSLIRIKLFTGRTHQIRVHMASEKHPLLFDDKYGNSYPSAKFFLHAHKLSFMNPEFESEEKADVEVGIPARMGDFMDTELELVDSIPI
jgi:23S rRNA-/tRNA-specific pseudouridylate synthase